MIERIVVISIHEYLNISRRGDICKAFVVW